MTAALPPGPRWPAIVQTVAMLRSTPEFIERVSRRYGDLFTVRTLVFGTQVFTSDPELIKQIMASEGDALHGGEANAPLAMITGQSSVAVLDGDAHRRARRLLMPPFHGERMHAYAEEMRSITERVVSEWKVGDAFPLLSAFQRISMDIMLANVFGLTDGPRRDRFAELAARMMDQATSPRGAFFFLIPALRRDLGPVNPWRTLKAEFEEHEAFLHEEIAARRLQLSRSPDAPHDDILSLLLQTRDDDGQGMSDREVRDQLATLVGAGHETTASSLAWVFERVLTHPEVHARLLAELDAATAAGRTAAADVAKLEYLDAVIKEVLRQRPSVPQFGRRVVRPIALRGYEIPAGVTLMPSVMLTHRRPDLYPEPEAFRPERFLGAKPAPYTYLPFGGGPRRCLGAAFAVQEMKVVAATVLQRMRLKLVKGAPLAPALRSIFLAPEGGAEVVLLGHRVPAEARGAVAN